MRIRQPAEIGSCKGARNTLCKLQVKCENSSDWLNVTMSSKCKKNKSLDGKREKIENQTWLTKKISNKS